MARKIRFSANPVVEKQHELQQHEQRLQREIQKLQSIIEEAPEKAEQVRKRQREVLIERASSDRGRVDPFSRIGESETSPRHRKAVHQVSLKAERNAQRTQFILLLLLLAVLCLIVLSRLPN